MVPDVCNVLCFSQKPISGHSHTSCKVGFCLFVFFFVLIIWGENVKSIASTRSFSLYLSLFKGENPLMDFSSVFPASRARRDECFRGGWEGGRSRTHIFTFVNQGSRVIFFISHGNDQ